MFGALAKAVPGRVTAAADGGNTFVTIGGHDPERGAYVHCDMIFGAWGGSAFRGDGDAMPLIPSNCTNIPMEIIEATYPLRFEQYGYVADTGGAGRSRGGLSIVRDIRLLRGDAILQVRSDRRKYLPWGMLGGKDGSPSWNYVNPDRNAPAVPSKITMTINEGDLYRHVTGGGGGYGPPLERAPADVAEDVRDEKMTRRTAEHEYGVVLQSDSFEVDVTATSRLRSRMQMETTSSAAAAS
jgi:N-methylhydantoinase B